MLLVLLLVMFLVDSIARLQICPLYISETTPQMVPMDLNIGFQGLALIQGQIYNPVLGGMLFDDVWG